MASFFQKYSMSFASIFWCKDNHFSKETTLEDVSPATNPRPKSPLDVDFEKENGVTTGLGLVPYLARLWEEDPYDRRIVFCMNMGVDFFSRSLIKLSAEKAFELISIIPDLPTAGLFSSPSSPSSPFSPLSHISQIGSQPDMDLHHDHEMPLAPEYFLFKRNGNSEIDDQDVGPDVLIPIDHESEIEFVLSENTTKYTYDDSFDSTQAKKIVDQVEHGEEYTQVIAHGAVTTYISDKCSIMERPRSTFVGGLSATFGVRANKPVRPNLEKQHPTEDITMRRHSFCMKALPYNKEQNDSIFFKNKYSCCSKQCRKVEVDTEEDREKVEHIGTSEAPK